MNDPILNLQARLDKAKSTRNINSDIQAIQRQLDELKLQPEIDPKSVSALNRQLDHLLEQKITLSDIEIDQNQIRQSGQQIGNAISSTISDSVRKTSDEITTELEKIGEQIENIQPAQTGFGKIIDFFKNFDLGTRIADSFKNIGKCRASVRISKYVIVLNMPFMPK